MTKAQVVQADIDDGLQGADHVSVIGKQGSGFADREIEHVGNVQMSFRPLDPDFQNLGSKALAIAVRATQVHVAEELHLYMLKA